MYQFDEIDEQEKLEGLKVGNQAAFNYFYHKYKVPLYANLLRMTKSHDLAIELLQEVFVKVWRKRNLTDTRKNFKAYLFTIAQRIVYDFFRRAAREQKLQEQVIAAIDNTYIYNPVEEAISYHESLQLLRDGIDQLPPQCRNVFQLCKLEGKSYEEVAGALGISIATVNNHIVKATKLLKRHFSISHLTLLISLWFFLR